MVHARSLSTFILTFIWPASGTGISPGEFISRFSTSKNTVEIDENQRSRYCRRTVESVKSSRRYIRYIERLLHFIFRNFY